MFFNMLPSVFFIVLSVYSYVNCSLIKIIKCFCLKDRMFCPKTFNIFARNIECFYGKSFNDFRNGIFYENIEQLQFCYSVQYITFFSCYYVIFLIIF